MPPKPVEDVGTYIDRMMEQELATVAGLNDLLDPGKVQIASTTMLTSAQINDMVEKMRKNDIVPDRGVSIVHPSSLFSKSVTDMVMSQMEETLKAPLPHFNLGKGRLSDVDKP